MENTVGNKYASFRIYAVEGVAPFQNETVFATRERRATDPASYLLVDGLRPGVDFDQLVERSAVGTCEGIEGRWPAPRHDTPPKASVI
jgi:hypothetical protein